MIFIPRSSANKSRRRRRPPGRRRDGDVKTDRISICCPGTRRGARRSREQRTASGTETNSRAEQSASVVSYKNQRTPRRDRLHLGFAARPRSRSLRRERARASPSPSTRRRLPRAEYTVIKKDRVVGAALARAPALDRADAAGEDLRRRVAPASTGSARGHEGGTPSASREGPPRRNRESGCCRPSRRDTPRRGTCC